jgi:hypothetical protein
VNRYPSLHVFLDESGTLQGEHRRREVALVGGVLLFGDYGARAQEGLRDLLRREVTALGGRFPADLHFSRQEHFTPEQHAELLRRLHAGLAGWEAGGRALRGVSLLHESDLADGGSPLLAEQSYDNRYLRLVLGLLEHLLFVDPEVAALLSPDAELHLHVANRRFTFDPDAVDAAALQAQGYDVRDDPYTPGNLVVEEMLRPREVGRMLQAALWRRGLRTGLRLGQVEVPSIDYHRQGLDTTPGLYLADLYLGQVRAAELARRRGQRPWLEAELLPPFRSLACGQGLEDLARMQAALQAGDVDQYLALSREAEAAGDPASVEPVVRAQEREAARLLDEGRGSLVPYLEHAARVVDTPGCAGQGLDQAERALRILAQVQTRPLHADLLALQVQISHANHTGRTREADGLWKEYEGREAELGATTEDMRLFAEIRNRRAVSLMDGFRHGEALEILRPLIADQESTREAFARRLGRAPADVPDAELGRCHGTLGQLHAFLGTAGSSAEAETCFRRALALFAAPLDRERQWVYLGHLACDREEAGRALWEEVCGQLRDLGETRPIVALHGQYRLALQLKGFLFEPFERRQAFLRAWQRDNPLWRYPAGAAREHPFGLIQQALGLLLAAAWRATRDEAQARAALQHFERSAEHMRQGGPLLQALAHVATLRRLLFTLEVSGGAGEDRERLSRALLALKGHLAEHFGAAAWGEDEQGQGRGYFGGRDPGPGTPVDERARHVQEAIRFNYW